MRQIEISGTFCSHSDCLSFSHSCILQASSEDMALFFYCSPYSWWPSLPVCVGTVTPGHNPGFSLQPLMQQVSLTSIRVTWEGLVTRVECADQFMVKWWREQYPNDYIFSELLPPHTVHIPGQGPRTQSRLCLPGDDIQKSNLRPSIIPKTKTKPNTMIMTRTGPGPRPRPHLNLDQAPTKPKTKKDQTK